MPNADADLLDQLGLKPFSNITRDFTDLGTHVLHEASDEGPGVTIAVAVSAMPATFWRFTITRVNEGDDRREHPTETVVVETGSGPLTQYWPAAVLVADNSLTIEPASKLKPDPIETFDDDEPSGSGPFGF